MHSDVVVGPVAHRGERHDAGVFHLPERELGFGLGPVAGDDLGDGPVVVAGDQHLLAEDLVLQLLAGVWVDVPYQPQVPGPVAGEFPADDPSYPRLADDVLDRGLNLVLGARILLRAKVAASSSSFLPALARVVPSNPQAWESCGCGECVKIARRSAP